MKKKILIIILGIVILTGLGATTFLVLNKCKKEECKPCDTPKEVISTKQEKSLEQMFLNNEISGYSSQKTETYEYKVDKASCKTIKQDSKGRYIMRCYISTLGIDFETNQKIELLDYPILISYMETLTGGKYREVDSMWYSDSLLQYFCWDQDKENGLECDDSSDDLTS